MPFDAMPQDDLVISKLEKMKQQLDTLGWGQGRTYYASQKQHPAPCLMGHIQFAFDIVYWDDEISAYRTKEDVLCREYYDIEEALTATGTIPDFVVGWNDDPQRTEDDIRRLIDDAILLRQKKLAEKV